MSGLIHDYLEWRAPVCVISRSILNSMESTVEPYVPREPKRAPRDKTRPRQRRRHDEGRRHFAGLKDKGRINSDVYTADIRGTLGGFWSPTTDADSPGRASMCTVSDAQSWYDVDDSVVGELDGSPREARQGSIYELEGARFTTVQSPSTTSIDRNSAWGSPMSPNTFKEEVSLDILDTPMNRRRWFSRDETAEQANAISDLSQQPSVKDSSSVYKRESYQAAATIAELPATPIPDFADIYLDDIIKSAVPVADDLPFRRVPTIKITNSGSLDHSHPKQASEPQTPRTKPSYTLPAALRIETSHVQRTRSQTSEIQPLTRRPTASRNKVPAPRSVAQSSYATSVQRNRQPTIQRPLQLPIGDKTVRKMPRNQSLRDFDPNPDSYFDPVEDHTDDHIEDHIASPSYISSTTSLDIADDLSQCSTLVSNLSLSFSPSTPNLKPAKILASPCSTCDEKEYFPEDEKLTADYPPSPSSWVPASQTDGTEHHWEEITDDRGLQILQLELQRRNGGLLKMREREEKESRRQNEVQIKLLFEAYAAVQGRLQSRA